MPRLGEMPGEPRHDENRAHLHHFANWRGNLRSRGALLRFYEDKGLLTPRRDGMNRVYSHRDRATLQLILRGKRVGLSLMEIKEILDLYKVDQRAQAQTALKKYKSRIVALEAQREDVDAAIEMLREQSIKRSEEFAWPRPAPAPPRSAPPAPSKHEAKKRLEEALTKWATRG